MCGRLPVGKGFLDVLRPGWCGHGKRDRRDLRCATRKLDQPGPPCPMPLGIADDGERTNDEQLPQITISLLGEPSEPLLAAAGVLPRYETDPRGQVPTRFE